MQYLYINPETKEHFFPVTIVNFNRNNQAKIIGSIKLNPTDKMYPDKKWVSLDDLYQKVNFTEEFIKSNTL